MRRADADIICLQEVDNVEALTRFRDFYLHKTTPRRYEQVILHEGNDGRGIDVAALATADVPLSSRSHAWMTVGNLGSKQERKALARRYPIAAKLLKQPRDAVFKRDCLEIEVRWPGAELTLFVCHFKSMGGGREKTVATRQVEALGVRRIIEQKFADPSAARWMVVGDLNDYRRIVTVEPRAVGDGRYPETVTELAETEPSGLDPLLADEFCVNLVERRARCRSMDPLLRTGPPQDAARLSAGLAGACRGHSGRTGDPARGPALPRPQHQAA